MIVKLVHDIHQSKECKIRSISLSCKKCVGLKKENIKTKNCQISWKSISVTEEDIPKDYRKDTKILSTIAKYNPKNIENNQNPTKKIQEKLYKKLTEGYSQEVFKIYEEYVSNFNFVNFLEVILKPIMYKIGEDWDTGKISISTEHIASNTAQILVNKIMQHVSRKQQKKKILICVPIGEEHRLGCDVLETYLSSKGFKTYNMGTSIPTESILNFIDDEKPDIVFLSITIKDNIQAGQRLVKKIKEQSNIPILVGGLAVQEDEHPKFDTKIISNTSLDEISKIIRESKNYH